MLKVFGNRPRDTAVPPEHVVKAAQVLQIADRFDSLIYHRDGQRYRSHQDALALLRQDAGNDLDEELLQRFIQAMALEEESTDQSPKNDSNGTEGTEELAVLEQLRRILSQLSRTPKSDPPPLPDPISTD